VRRVIALVWIALNVSSCGLFIWLPGVLASEGRITLNAYILLTLVALAQFPGYAASLWLVEAWGSQADAGLLPRAGRCQRAHLRARPLHRRVRRRPVLRRLLQPRSVGRGLPSTSELFPIRLRSTAFGMVEGVGKAAAIAGPYLFGRLLVATGATMWSLMFVAAVMAAGALVTLLGRETRGTEVT
jgi:putative MFS transporter